MANRFAGVNFIVILSLLMMSFIRGETEAVRFSHDDWTNVLQKFVNDKGLVDYDGLGRDREVFDHYLHSIEQVSPRSHQDRFPTRNDALAYYLNAYNAQVFRGVLDRGPEKKSVWRGLISGYAFFVRMRITIGGEQMNLKKLEDKIVREEFQDPRVHAALNCASLGCPRLPRRAFDPEILDDQLDHAVREFVDEARNCSVDAENRIVTLSQIFDWFSSDFLDYERDKGNSNPNLIDYVNRYRPTEAQIPRSYEVKFIRYDKRINKQ